MAVVGDGGMSLCKFSHYNAKKLGQSRTKKVGILLLFCLTLIRAICSAHLAKVGDDTFYEAIKMMMCLSKQQQKSL